MDSYQYEKSNQSKLEPQSVSFQWGEEISLESNIFGEERKAISTAKSLGGIRFQKWPGGEGGWSHLGEFLSPPFPRSFVKNPSSVEEKTGVKGFERGGKTGVSSELKKGQCHNTKTFCKRSRLGGLSESSTARSVENRQGTPLHIA